ncbi:modulator of macroautophagy TMEM150B isoform X2 [Callorhinchus milii]|uniref:modulator of macroautophagy TMEM150B isoform X2 n=1 Tax=Callorhinchus milii TaxID=7868 RepID=UPI001C3F74C2|nr:modulator of macroautophagy TMEM150B isoform X2 [Callorhinchus milii]
MMWAWALFPILLMITAAGGFWTVFGMAVVNGAVNLTVEFPYISTCGAYPPQSCLFSQVMNIGAFLVTWVCVIRYQQIRDLGCHSHLNTVSLVTGCLSALGATLVGNFQVGLTYQVKPRHGGKWCGPVRIICCLACTASLASMLWLHVSGMRSAAAICEWVAGMVLLLLFGLFAVDFRHVDGHYFHVQRNPVVIQNSTTTLEL